MKKTIIATALLTLAGSAYAAPKGDIMANGTDAYAIDTEGRVVRDNFGGCVRSIHWSKETAIPACEGWPEPKPEPKAAPAPAPAPKAEPKPEPKVEVQPAPKEEPFPVFRGLFKTNSAELSDDAFGKLDLVVEYLKKHPDMRIRVEGYTDSTGSAEYNKKLSQKRAEAVKAYLVKQGISADRIEAVGYGEENPVADNSTPEGRQANRRVEIKPIK